jgi:pyrimidine-specific ribonucleoside hydrolase
VRRSIAVGLVFVMLLAACSDGTAATSVPDATTTTAASTTSTTSVPDSRTPVILDYSPTVSDVGALVFVASHPDLRLLAVTLPGTGESYCDEGVAHTRGLLELLGQGYVPVACGPNEPITGWNAFPTSWRVGSNEIDLPEAEPNESRGAPELIVDLLLAAEAPIEVLAVGPLTNLALALEHDPAIIESIAEITIMGGAVDVPGNVFRNDVGEWNIWVDPTAAGMVLASGAPVTLVPLDATNHLPANPIFFNALDAAAANPGSTVVRDLIAGDEFWLAGGFFFWDELAAVVLVDESIVEFETRTLVVDDTERENKGWTREDASGTEVRVAVSADRRAFEQLYLDTLIGAPTDMGYVAASPDVEEYLRQVAEIGQIGQAAFDATLDEAAIALGQDEGDESGFDFMELLNAALPTIFDESWPAEIASLEALEVPDEMTELHERWVGVLRDIASREAELLEAIGSGGARIDEFFSQFFEVCSLLQAEADRSLLDLDFAC